MDRYLFLDIDGVCNHELFYRRTRVNNEPTIDDNIDIEVIKRLNSLKDLNVKIVISSSWGADADKPLNDSGLELPIVGHTEHVSYMYHSWAVRGNEIKKWLNDHCNRWVEDYNYVIVDDDADMLLEQINNFVKTNPYEGLTDEKLAKIREILSEE